LGYPKPFEVRAPELLEGSHECTLEAGALHVCNVKLHSNSKLSKA